jgi:hypothetical protein
MNEIRHLSNKQKFLKKKHCVGYDEKTATSSQIGDMGGATLRQL